MKDGQRLNLAQVWATPITMIDLGGSQISVPGRLSPDGSGFSVARTGL